MIPLIQLAAVYAFGAAVTTAFLVFLNRRIVRRDGEEAGLSGRELLLLAAVWPITSAVIIVLLTAAVVVDLLDKMSGRRDL